jgi:hypothetical protein
VLRDLCSCGKQGGGCSVAVGAVDSFRFIDVLRHGFLPTRIFPHLEVSFGFFVGSFTAGVRGYGDLGTWLMLEDPIFMKKRSNVRLRMGSPVPRPGTCLSGSTYGSAVGQTVGGFALGGPCEDIENHDPMRTRKD